MKKQKKTTQDQAPTAASEETESILFDDESELDLDYEVDTEDNEDEIDPNEVIDGLQTQLTQKEHDFREMEDKWKRTYADFANFRRRKDEEIQRIRKTATERLVMKLLDVLDGFELGLANMDNSTDDHSLDGIQLIYQNFKDVLSAEGIEAIECLNQPFDPHKHEAVRMVELPDHDEGIIVEIIQKGYSMNGKTIRTPLVGVSRLPDETQAKNSTNKEDKDLTTTNKTN